MTTKAVNGTYSLQFAPATRRAEQITHNDLPPGSTPKRAPTAPERTISGGQPIKPKIIRGLVAQQQAADECLIALHGLCDELEALG